MSKKPKTEFQKHESRMAKLDHKLKMAEERRMVFRRMKQENKNEN